MLAETSAVLVEVVEHPASVTTTSVNKYGFSVFIISLRGQEKGLVLKCIGINLAASSIAAKGVTICGHMTSRGYASTAGQSKTAAWQWGPDCLSFDLKEIQRMKRLIFAVALLSALNVGCDMRGRDGAPGATGAVGAAGASGTTGASGSTGADGVSGAQGVDGKTGADGVNGRRGTTGAAGADGATGAAGADGAKGAEGRPAGR